MENYKNFIQKNLAENNIKVRGSYIKLAKFLGTNSSFVSQVLSGEKHFSIEQILKCSKYLKLNHLDQEYLVHLNLFERAGDLESKKYFESKLKEIIVNRNKISQVITKHRNLSTEEQSIYYSNWIYSAIRLSSDISNCKTIQALSKKLKIPLKETEKAVNFLLDKDLLKKTTEGFRPTETNIHLNDESPFIFNHHKNWRIKAIENFSQFENNRDLAFTAPLTISKDDFMLARGEILKLIKKLNSVVEKSQSEELACLSIDFFVIK